MHSLRLALCVLLTPSLSLAQTDAATEPQPEEMPPEESRLYLMVPDVGASGDIDQAAVTPIHELLMSRFQELGLYKVFGTADLIDMLEAEQRKMLVGCEDDGCLAQLGGAMGVNLIAKASVGKLGETYIFNLKIFNVETAEAEARCVREVKGVVDRILPAVSECIDAVTKELSGRYELHEAPATAMFGPIPVYVTGGVAVAAGIATLALDFAAGRKADTLRDDPNDEDAYNSGKSLQTAERVTLGLTVAAAIAAGVLAVFTDFNPPPPDETAVEVGPDVGAEAAGVVLRGRF